MQRILEGQLSSDEIDVILTTHNHLELTIRCVEALYQYTPNPFRLTIIDDSTDLTPDYFKTLASQYPNVQYIRPDILLKSGNQIINIGLRNTRNELVVNINNSVQVEPDWLNVALWQIKQNPQIGIIGFKLLRLSGSIGHAGLIVNHRGLFNIGLGEGGHRHTHVAEVPAVGWALVLYRRKAYPDGLDEKYYIGFRGWDDVDNCLALRKRGWKVYYCGFGAAYHEEGATRVVGTQQFWDDGNTNAQRFFARWGDELQPIVIMPLEQLDDEKRF